jgi:hypothetical protein
LTLFAAKQQKSVAVRRSPDPRALMAVHQYRAGAR